MNNDLIFLPVLAHVVLIFILYIYLGIVKSGAVKEGNYAQLIYLVLFSCLIHYGIGTGRNQKQLIS